VPTAESVTNISHGLSQPVRPQLANAGPGLAGGPYQTVCAACHQAEGQGMPGAFPPLAGSEWLLANPEVPVRIAILGLSGAIEVKGAKYNGIMPPPPGMTDATIAEAITYARTHFGNNASRVTPEFVKQVRDSLTGRTNPWSADELAPLLKAGGTAATSGGKPGGANAAGSAAATAGAPGQ
jgi:mono/diheme cytochrome c family protein